MITKGLVKSQCVLHVVSVLEKDAPVDAGSKVKNQELVLLCVMWKGGGGSGCFVTHFINEIQECMNNLMIGYQLQFIDLDIFQRLPNNDTTGGPMP